MNFCLPKELTKPFLTALKDGTLDPVKLSEATSAERRAAFAKVIGDKYATEVNAEFESKLLLKNQQAGMITWAKSVGGLKPQTLKDLVSKVSKLDRVLNPTEEKAFLQDLANKKLGTEVTLEEAQKISALAKAVQDAKGGDRMTYGRARVALGNYVSELKNANNPNILQKGVGGAVSEVAGIAKGLKASLDNSAIFRQGWKTLFSHPTVWLKNSAQSFMDLAQQVGGKAVMDEVQADIQSRPTYDLMKQAKLDVGTTEEQFPSHIVEKVPVLGQLYKASEAAYTGFVYRTRADVFDKYLNIAKTAGVDISDKTQLQSIGNLVNSLTGRGNLGKAEQVAGAVNNIFFSPRFLKSNIDFLTAHQFQKGVTPFVRKQAAINLVKVVAGTAGVLAIANAILPGSVETDPRSSNFGKIKVKGTTFDVTGGMGSVLTLAAKMATMSSKSSVTDKVTPLNSGKYGAQTGVDVLVNFAEGKLSPIASIVRDILKGQDFNGNKPTLLGEASNLLTPLPITNAMQLYEAKGAPVLAGIIADMLGISVSPPFQKAKTPPTSLNDALDNTPILGSIRKFMGATGPQTVGEARKQALIPSKSLASLPDDAPIPKGVVFIDPTGGIGSIEKVGAKATGKIASSVLQIVNNKTNETTFFRIAAKDFDQFKTLIDDGVAGIAGIPTKAGDIFHITAKSPEQMLAKGFTDGGMAEVSKVPTKVASHSRSNAPSVREYTK